MVPQLCYGRINGIIRHGKSGYQSYTHAKNKSISAKSALEQEDVNQLFHLPISEIAFGQLQRAQQDLKVTQLNENKDIWKFNWGSRFQSPKAYKELIGHSQIHNTYKWLWDCFCQPKHKVFFWLLIKDRLSTRNILKRKNMVLDSYNCVLCNENVEETVEHLFLHCNFATQCWNFLNLDIPSNSDFPDIVVHFKSTLQSQFFMMVVILMCWTIWLARNDLIFKGIPANLGTSKSFLCKEFLLLMHRVKPSLSVAFDQ